MERKLKGGASPKVELNLKVMIVVMVYLYMNVMVLADPVALVLYECNRWVQALSLYNSNGHGGSLDLVLCEYNSIASEPVALVLCNSNRSSGSQGLVAYECKGTEPTQGFSLI